MTPQKKVQIAPSLIAADATAFAKEIKAIEAAGADLLHMDVMDGTFVPNITFGPWIHQAIRNLTHLPLDTHLMVEDPDRYLEAFVKAGANTITVHVEACRHIHRTLMRIGELGAKVGVTLNPGTALETIYPVLDLVDQVLIMSVNPGFAGQPFIAQSSLRVEQLAKYRANLGFNFKIAVDGGVGEQNADLLRSAGADILVAGSSVFRSPDYQKAIEKLRG